MRSTSQTASLEGSNEPLHTRSPLGDRQQQAISYAFHSTLLSNPNITIEMVRRAAEQ